MTASRRNRVVWLMITWPKWMESAQLRWPNVCSRFKSSSRLLRAHERTYSYASKSIHSIPLPLRHQITIYHKLNWFKYIFFFCFLNFKAYRSKRRVRLFKWRILALLTWKLDADGSRASSMICCPDIHMTRRDCLLLLLLLTSINRINDVSASRLRV